MSIVCVICPVTGKAFSTGIETDPESFDLFPDITAVARCPYCARDHRWTKRDAYLVDPDAMPGPDSENPGSGGHGAGPTER